MGFQSAFNKSFGSIAGGIFTSKAITALTEKNKELAAKNEELTKSERAAKAANLSLANELHSRILNSPEGRKIKEIERMAGNTGEAKKLRDQYTETLRGFRKNREAKTEETNDGNK